MRYLLTASLLLSGTAGAAVCPTTSLETDVIGLAIASGNTTGLPNSFNPTCTSTTAPDYQVEFTATMAGVYTFDLVGSAYDTLLSAHSTTDCLTQLACNDDTYGVQSEVMVALNAGEVVVLNIDGYSANAGTFVLNSAYAPPPVCAADTDLGSVATVNVTGNSCGMANDFDNASCAGGQGSEDVAFRWVAPTTDTYTFTTVGSTYDTGMTLRNMSCLELMCDDDGAGYPASAISTYVTAGTEYLVVVDGYSTGNCGDFTLNIYPGGICIDSDGDGVCDPADLCTGNDASGDSDADGICDDLDMRLELDGAPVPGQPYRMAAFNAYPGSRVFFFVSTRGPGAGSCAPNGTFCFDIQRERPIGSAIANASGTAVLNLTVPPTVQSGREVWFQAAWMSGRRGNITEVEATQVP